MSEWIEVASNADFQVKDRKLVDLGENRQICIFKLDDGYYATSAWCSHQKASLAIGDVTDHQVMCPLHGARFDLRTGRHLSMPAVRPIAAYEVKVEENKIFVKV
jgi:nitrite reductase/ring-hydroxylating ferredoxin subunit